MKAFGGMNLIISSAISVIVITVKEENIIEYNRLINLWISNNFLFSVLWMINKGENWYYVSLTTTYCKIMVVLCCHRKYIYIYTTQYRVALLSDEKAQIV